MEIEIVNAYISEKDDKAIKGTLHIFIIGFGSGIDLRGIFWLKRGSNYLFRLPNRQAVDLQTGEKVRYPIFSFVDHGETDKLMSEIKRLAPAFIDEKLAETAAGSLKAKAVSRV